ncbi:MAG TPA: glycosyltransferase [Sediminibacterium sp.]|uniref:glycosyltransferase n=1 Tax=Sediminibacterium sp. TaxID=1917865 RepID=UPI0008C8B3C9|nr:glycosyltransferase [Sediminibacterium sp.]OHC86175.1 MAG: glycosyl transferase family 2 [Sphingobacteriia bacterium RIFOXYC2_FULL_35_18]OHC89688.1 MAG: glycosyl transferase family 2 [Sphingobacteriia bacterium RIFOXYD2_FULL_35_12]HLD54427.1 glycosyltransferase [Sediminibacterium sp.]
MSKGSKQVFQTSNPTRWQRFKWTFRLLLFLLFITVIAIIIAIKTAYEPTVPILQSSVFKRILVSDENQDSLAKKYQGFRKFIDDKWSTGNGSGQNESAIRLSHSKLFSDSLGIRSAFYVDWDPQAFFSLRRNINKLNLILPEWMFFDPTGDSLIIRKDKRGYDLIKKTKGLRVMPMLTNNINGKWDGVVVSRILNDPKKSEKLINDLYKWIKVEGFAGINIDFEELVENDNRLLTQFLKKLSDRFHAGGLLTSIDVMPFNEDYDYEALAAHTDYIFLMAYDQYTSSTKPGPISGQKWIEAAVDQIVQKVPISKLVLCIAGFGYDWPKGGEGSDVTYQQALSIAKENNSKITYDNDSYNLYFTYKDKLGHEREVHFTDAATNFNAIRFSTEYGFAGTALWRMGSEDSRLWDFYHLPMNKTSVQKFNFEEFTKVETSNDVDFMGEGEILDVISTPTPGHIRTELDKEWMLISEEFYDTLPSMFVVKQFGKSTEKKMVLTFDDGPHPVYTRQILDILDRYNVVANFFIVGIEAEKNIPLVKRIYNSGHEISNHTFTHPNMATVSKQRAYLEMDATKLLIEAITGRSTIMFRAPFNADSRPETMEELVPVALSREKNYLTIGENIDPLDWQIDEDKNFNGDSIFNRVVRMKDRGNIILLHDAGGDRSATVDALPKIIEYFHKQGYKFTTVADLMGKTRDDVMPPVPNYKENYLLRFNYFLAEGGYYLGKIFNALFLLFLTLGSIRLFIVLATSILARKKEKKQTLLPFNNYPLVSIIVPAYNEEVNAVSSINNLLRCDYPNFNIIFVNDGSTDNTLEVVKAAFKNTGQVTILNKINGGKASALNHGIAATQADYVVCIDADTKLKTDAVSKLMMHFNDSTIGAVAGNVKVGNEVNLITRWQSIEYITSQNIDRKAFGYFNAITVVPGAIGAFSKLAIEEAGGFTSDTLAEDCDLTIRILRCGYSIANENNAIALTEAPETLKQFMSQRFRWTFGVLQTFWKNRDALFNTNYPKLGFIALPDILLFKYIIPLFAPFADFLMLIGLLTGSTSEIGMYYAIFLGIDILLALFAFSFEKEPIWKILWLIPQRVIYRWLLLIVLFKTFRKAVKGELQHWGVLKRTGNVQEAI